MLSQQKPLIEACRHRDSNSRVYEAGYTAKQFIVLQKGRESNIYPVSFLL